MTQPRTRLSDLDDHNGQQAADAIDAAQDRVKDARDSLEVELHDLGLSETASERIARNAIIRAAKEHS